MSLFLEISPTALLWSLLPVLLLLLMMLLWRRRHDDVTRPSAVAGALPLIGNVLEIDRTHPHFTLTGWATVYGDVYRFRLFGEDVIVLNSPSSVHEALVMKDPCCIASFEKINSIEGQRIIVFHDDIIFSTDSGKWRMMKQLSAQLLRMTLNSEETGNFLANELQQLETELRQSCRQDVDPSHILQTSVFNAVSLAIHGRRYSCEDEEMIAYRRATRLFSEACSPVNGAELDAFPWLRHLPHKPLDKMKTARDLLDSFIDQELAKAKAEYQRGSCRSLLDRLLQSRDSEHLFGDGSTAITDDDIRSIFIDILVGEIQQRLFHSISSIIGVDRLPSVSDRNSLDMVEATTLELLRYISHVPLGLPHMTTDDTSVSGFFVDRQTKVLINLWKIHHDETTWTDPWQFRPERFLDNESGHLLPATHELLQSVLAFGVGRRTCLGQTLALQRLFVFIAFISQRFHLSPSSSPDQVLPSCDPRQFQLGLVLEPPPFTARFIPRAQKLDGVDN